MKKKRSKIIIFIIVLIFTLEQVGYSAFPQKFSISHHHLMTKQEAPDTIETLIDRFRNKAFKDEKNLDVVFNSLIRHYYLQTQKKEPSKEELQNLKKVFERNAWALKEGKLDVTDVFVAYFVGPQGARELLKEKVKTGMVSLSEILLIVELYPKLFEKIFLDLDDTVFTTKGYLGSEQWFRDEWQMYNRRTQSLRKKKKKEEEWLLDASFFETTEPTLTERLKTLQERQSHIEIIGLTARRKQTKEQTEKILAQLGLELSVIYTGRANLKRPILQQKLKEWLIRKSVKL